MEVSCRQRSEADTVVVMVVELAAPPASANGSSRSSGDAAGYFLEACLDEANDLRLHTAHRQSARRLHVARVP